MFDNLKTIGALTSLMKNRDALREAMGRVRASLEATRVTGEAGAGAAKVVATGAMRIVDVELSPGLVGGMAADDRTRDLARTLIADAVNHALASAQACAREAIERESRALGLGDLGGLSDLLR